LLLKSTSRHNFWIKKRGEERGRGGGGLQSAGSKKDRRHACKTNIPRVGHATDLRREGEGGKEEKSRP